jgi:hypothetical protein
MTDLLTVINPISAFCEFKINNNNITQKFQKLKFYDYDNLTQFLFNQKSINNFSPNYSLYKLNVKDDRFSHHIDITTDIENMYHTTIQADDDFLVFHTLSIDTFINFIMEHMDGRQYLIVPLIMSTELLDISHQTSLVIDLIYQKVYLADPNGKSEFFNKIYNKDVSNKIDLLLQSYFMQFNQLGFDYEFIPSKKWNPEKICINKAFNQSIIGSGHCVITSIMLGHYLLTTQDYITNIYNLFSELSDDEILYIINSYMNGINQLLSN